MRFIVFKCRKCGHLLYVENTETAVADIKRVSYKDCPECGEDSYENWILVGMARSFPGDGGVQEDE